jgi:hypothetical protein
MSTTPGNAESGETSVAAEPRHTHWHLFESQLTNVHGWLRMPYALMGFAELVLFLFLFLDPFACAPSGVQDRCRVFFFSRTL